jgi:hypothetical protein
MTAAATTSQAVLALLDDTSQGAAIIEWSALLARALQRELELVYIESTQAMLAAALPQTRVLAHAGAQWQPFAPSDVERGFRAQVERLRSLAGTIAPRHAVSWQLRTVRAALPQAALELFAAEELLFVGSPIPLRPLARRDPPSRRARAVLVAGVTDGSEAGARSVAIATQLAQALSAPLQVLRLTPGRDPAAPLLPGGPLQADIVVLPRALATRHHLSRVPCPVLLVA